MGPAVNGATTSITATRHRSSVTAIVTFLGDSKLRNYVMLVQNLVF
jgi:hypothetical protein